MNAKEARRLARRIVSEAPNVRLTGLRFWRDGRPSYAIDVVDVKTGGSFVVWSEADWDERRETAEALDSAIRGLDTIA